MEAGLAMLTAGAIALVLGYSGGDILVSQAVILVVDLIVRACLAARRGPR